MQINNEEVLVMEMEVLTLDTSKIFNTFLSKIPSPYGKLFTFTLSIYVPTKVKLFILALEFQIEVS